MRHLVSIYRWELFLLFALPAVDGLLDIAVVEANLRLAAWFDYECTRSEHWNTPSSRWPPR